MKRFALATAAGLLLLTTLVPNAQAATTSIVGHFAYVTTKQDVLPSSEATQGAICPAGFTTTGAGGSLTSNAGWLSEMKFDSGPRTTVTVSAFSGSTKMQTLTNYAVCAKDSAVPHGYANSIKTSSFVDSNSISCPSGQPAIGGTGSFDQSFSTSNLLSSFPDQATPTETWEMAGNSASTTNHYIASAVCATAPLTVRHVVRQTILGPNQTKTLSAPCPSGTHVTAGGFESGGGLVLAEASKPFDSRDAGTAPDDGWRATLVSGSAFPTVFAVHALCLR